MSDTLEQYVQEALSHLVAITQRMGLDTEIAQAKGADDVPLLDISGPGASEIAQGEVLDALQVLVNRMAAKTSGVHGEIVYVDADGYRSRRESELQELAQELIQDVRATGEPASAGRLTAFERRIVHLAIDAEEGVSTRSEGQGIDRRLLVVPS